MDTWRQEARKWRKGYYSGGLPVSKPPPKAPGGRKRTDTRSSITVSVWLDCEKTRIDSFLNSFLSILGRGDVEEDMDLAASSSTVLRGLRKAGFRDAVEMKIDKEIVYSGGTRNDVQDAIDILSSKKFATTSRVKCDLASPSWEMASVTVHRVHRKGSPAIVLKVGVLEKKELDRLEDYLKRNLVTRKVSVRCL